MDDKDPNYKKTILYSPHLKLKARMTNFSGWEMPLQYTGIIAEHNHTRNQVSIFDICHMGRIIIEGLMAKKDLLFLTTVDIEKQKNGQCKYGFMLNPEGGIIDDLIIYKFNENKYMMVINAGTTAKDLNWINKHLSNSTRLTNITDSYGKLDLQGPKSLEVLQPLISDNLSKLKYFNFIETDFIEVSVILSRTGYTGELGYELYIPKEKVIFIWESLLTNPLIKPAGLGARDTLRLEAALSLYGNELSENYNPIQAGLGKFLREDFSFCGGQALKAIKRDDNNPVLVGLVLEGRRAARHNNEVFLNNESVGTITSGSWAPSLNQSIALAYIQKKSVDINKEYIIDTGRNKLSATITALPFYQQGTARIKLT